MNEKCKIIKSIHIANGTELTEDGILFFENLKKEYANTVNLGDLDKAIIELRNWYDIKNAQYPANDIESKAYKKGWQNGVGDVLSILINIRDSKK